MMRSRTGWGRFRPWARQVPQAARTNWPRRRARRRKFRTLKIPPGSRWGEETLSTLDDDTPNRPPRSPDADFQEKKGPAFQPAQEGEAGRLVSRRRTSP